MSSLGSLLTSMQSLDLISHEPQEDINVLCLRETRSQSSLVHLQCLQHWKENKHCRVPRTLGLIQQRCYYGDKYKPVSCYAAGVDLAVWQP